MRNIWVSLKWITFLRWADYGQLSRGWECTVRQIFLPCYFSNFKCGISRQMFDLDNSLIKPLQALDDNCGAPHFDRPSAKERPSILFSGNPGAEPLYRARGTADRNSNLTMKEFHGRSRNNQRTSAVVKYFTNTARACSFELENARDSCSHRIQRLGHLYTTKSE